MSGPDLHSSIKELTAQPQARCAVAFWGAGSEEIVTQVDARIICNLKAGGTNPFALRKLKTKQIRQYDLLHAKVYIGQEEAVVASANASANGLGLEGSEQTSWMEAGVRLSNIAPVGAWFEKLWEQSWEIKADDWAAAEKSWRERRSFRPTTSFSAFDETVPVLPLAGCYVPSSKWEYITENVEKQLGKYDNLIQQRLDTGLEVEHPDDEPVLKDRWVLCWTRGKDGLPAKRRKLWWVRLSDVVVRDAYRYSGDGKRRDCILGVERVPPVPFNANEARFIEALREVLARDEYVPLREREYDGAWFKPRAELIAGLRRDLKRAYKPDEALAE